MAGLTKGSWSSVRSRIASALQRAEVQVMPGRRTEPLSEDWAKLYRALLKNGRQAALGRLMSYLSGSGVSPDEVSDGHITRFAWELNTRSLRGRFPSFALPSVVGTRQSRESLGGRSNC
jgi:hypothetical protein